MQAIFHVSGDRGRLGEEMSHPLEANALFQPDTVLPLQYFERMRRNASPEGEKKLLLAVLADAVGCFQKYSLAYDKKGRARFEDAEHWIMDESDDGVFSFNAVCELLEIDPDYLRRGLLKWKEKQESSQCLPVKVKGRQKTIPARRRAMNGTRERGVKSHGKVSGLRH